MSDGGLLRFGKAARYMCSPEANLGKEQRRVFVIQLKGSRKGLALSSQGHGFNPGGHHFVTLVTPAFQFTTTVIGGEAADVVEVVSTRSRLYVS